MRKRVISWLLTVVMVVSMLPTSVLADTLAADQEQQTQQEQIAPVDTENTVPAEDEETQEQQEQQERRHAPKAVIHLSISYYKSKDKTGSIVNICSMTGKKTACEKFASVFLCILHNVFPLF